MYKMFAIIKVVALFVVVLVAVSAHPMSGEKKDVSHHEAVVLPTEVVMKNNDMSWMEGIQNQQRDDDPTTEPPVATDPPAGSTTSETSGTTTPKANATTVSNESNPMKPSNSIAIVLLFSVLIIVPGVFFGMC